MPKDAFDRGVTAPGINRNHKRSGGSPVLNDLNLNLVFNDRPATTDHFPLRAEFVEKKGEDMPDLGSDYEDEYFFDSSDSCSGRPRKPVK